MSFINDYTERIRKCASLLLPAVITSHNFKDIHVHHLLVAVVQVPLNGYFVPLPWLLSWLPNVPQPTNTRIIIIYILYHTTANSVFVSFHV